ncbi:MAG: glycosyltransferase family 2 protein [Chitinispirillaceae bacterium]|nr:glycosyltransferase family 2 protein [Chitinispirillaceae bacterium]
MEAVAGVSFRMNEHPLVSIVILNWNGKALVQECLASLTRLHYKPVEVLVVDNHSSDGSLEFLRGVDGITLIANEKNLGYARGNNVGFRSAHGTYCAVLNNDMVVDPCWLDEPIRILEENERIGIISCRQMRLGDREKIDGLYHYLAPTLKTGLIGEGATFSDHPEYATPGYVLSANGGSMIVRKTLVERLGGFDDRLFAYSEDFDLCLRAFLHSWHCYYVPQAVVFHRGSASFGKNPGRKLFYEWRNRYFLLYKYFPVQIIMRHLYWLLWNEWRTIGHIFFKLKKPALYFSIWGAIFSGIAAFSDDRRENLGRFAAKEGDLIDFMRNPIRHE